jgi:hypothetical protein
VVVGWIPVCFECADFDAKARNSFSAGFAAKSSYYRIFKELTGISPKEYAIEFSKSINEPFTPPDQEDVK